MVASYSLNTLFGDTAHRNNILVLIIPYQNSYKPFSNYTFKRRKKKVFKTHENKPIIFDKQKKIKKK